MPTGTIEIIRAISQSVENLRSSCNHGFGIVQAYEKATRNKFWETKNVVESLSQAFINPVKEFQEQTRMAVDSIRSASIADLKISQTIGAIKAMEFAPRNYLRDVEQVFGRIHVAFTEICAFNINVIPRALEDFFEKLRILGRKFSYIDPVPDKFELIYANTQERAGRILAGISDFDKEDIISDVALKVNQRYLTGKVRDMDPYINSCLINAKIKRGRGRTFANIDDVKNIFEIQATSSMSKILMEELLDDIAENKHEMQILNAYLSGYESQVIQMIQINFNINRSMAYQWLKDFKNKIRRKLN